MDTKPIASAKQAIPESAGMLERSSDVVVVEEYLGLIIKIEKPFTTLLDEKKEEVMSNDS